MDLPAELREKVYEYAVGSRIYPVKSADMVHWGQGYNHNVPYYRQAVLPNLAFLTVRTKVYQEAMNTAWERTWKCLVSFPAFTVVVSASVTPEFNWLNKIILDFSMKEWFRFFGVCDILTFRFDQAQ